MHRREDETVKLRFTLKVDNNLSNVLDNTQAKVKKVEIKGSSRISKRGNSSK